MTGTKKIAMFGSAATLALAVGFGGVGAMGTATAATHPAPSAAVAPAKAAPNVHDATLMGCISGLDC